MPTDATPRLAASKAIGPGFYDWTLGGVQIRIPVDDRAEPGQPPRIVDLGAGFGGAWDPLDRVYRLSASGLAADEGILGVSVFNNTIVGVEDVETTIAITPSLPALGWIRAIHCYLPVTFGGLTNPYCKIGIAGQLDLICSSISLGTNVQNRPATFTRSPNWQLHVDAATELLLTVWADNNLSNVTNGEFHVEIEYAERATRWVP